MSLTIPKDEDEDALSTVELPVAPQVNGWAMLNSVKSSLFGGKLVQSDILHCLSKSSDFFFLRDISKVERIVKPWSKIHLGGRRQHLNS